ncbi:NAD(P)H dehydrogenase [quinone] 1 isoform X2 [Scleropages formosus]|uniref:NAD(P)H dehydrogenase [quinone] 1 isoform X2 n=1 Tax=Scleropages formosus TaxID=113540 RepID=UPI0008788F90|nr:NAD(P)H dehydrogenase [quinone] 1-like isoform X2 [Scleropages formosus]
MATKRSALIVYAHQSPNSFNAAARDVAVDVLQGQGCQVTVSDLYAMGFKPAATAQDIIGELQNPDHFRYNEEAMVAWQEGRLSEDISAEQRKVEEANLIIFQDKKAILSFTTGASEPMFLPDGINGDMNVTLWPIQYGVLNFCGFQVLPPQIFWAPARSPPSVREAMLEVWRTRLGALWEETPLSFIKTDLFDLSLQTGFRLRPEVKEELQADAYGITTGHHLGKPLPPNNQMRPPPPAI